MPKNWERFTVNTDYDKDRLEQLRLFVWKAQVKDCACGFQHKDAVELGEVLDWAYEKLKKEVA